MMYGLHWKCGLAVIWSLGLGLSAHGEFIPSRYEARHVTVAPVIDGRLTDEAWTTAQEISKFFAYKSGGDPAASTGAARIMWDDANLYLGLSMDDNNIVPSTVVSGRGGFDGPLYEGDVIEFFVRETDSSPQYFEFEWSPNGDQFDARFNTVRFGPPGTGWDSGMTSAVQVVGTHDDQSDTDQSWTVEAAIPLSGFDPIDVGSNWFFTVARYDYFENGGQFDAHLMMSTPGDAAAPMGGVTRGFHTYEIYDVIQFVAAVPEPNTLVLVMVAMFVFAVKRRV